MNRYVQIQKAHSPAAANLALFKMDHSASVRSTQFLAAKSPLSLSPLQLSMTVSLAMWAVGQLSVPTSVERQTVTALMATT